MELTNEFRVPAPVDEAWEVLTDVERIAPCMPGATLDEVEGEEYRGSVKVKVGPMTAQYKGVARFVEQDDGAHRAVLKAEGREMRGQGNANATVTAQMAPDGDGTAVSVITDLTVTGRVAQFGRGVMADVASKLLVEFADCLERKLQNGDSAGAATGDGSQPTMAGEGPGRQATEAEPIDLVGTAGIPVAKRLVPVGIAVTTVLWLLSIFLRRRRRRS
jgi:uncharacterized protein